MDTISWFCDICDNYACVRLSCTEMHSIFVKENKWCCTSSRDLIMDTPLRDRKRRKALRLAGIKPLTSRVFTHRTCTTTATCTDPFGRYFSFCTLTGTLDVVLGDCLLNNCFCNCPHVWGYRE